MGRKIAGYAKLFLPISSENIANGKKKAKKIHKKFMKILPISRQTPAYG